MTTRKRRIRKANADSVWNVLGRSLPTPEEDVREIMVKVRLAFEKMRTGQGDDDICDTLGACMNVGYVRAEAIAPQLVAIFGAGADAVSEAQRFNREHGRYAFTGPGLTAVEDALQAYEEVLRASSPLQMLRAAEEATRRVQRMQREKERGQPA